MNDIKNIFAGSLLFSEPLSKHAWYGIGGPAEYYCIPGTVEDLQKLVRFCAERKIPYWVIGKGTNVLISDDGVEGAVINLSAACHFIKTTDMMVTVGAAFQVPKLVLECEKRSLGGLEFFAGIPGSVGGALKMNAGCNGREFYNYVYSVTYLDLDRMRTAEKNQIEFRYRHVPLFDDPGKIILSAELELYPEDPSVLMERRKTSLDKRQQTQPISQPSCGSVFKNPENRFAGNLIEQCGLKGFRQGNASVSVKHGNFIVNEGSAKAADVLNIIQTIQKTVFAKFNIWLEPEVKLIGFPEPLIKSILKHD